MSPLTQLLVTIIILLGFFGQAIFGFGGGLVTIPLVSLVIGVKETVTLISIFQLLMGLLIFSTYKTTDWGIGLPITIGMLIGVPLGLFSLTSFSEPFLRRFLALFMLAFLAQSQFFPRLNLRADRTLKWTLPVGLLFGWMQGLLGTGGPIIVIYLLAVLSNRITFRSTLIYVSFLSNLIRVLLSITGGLLTGQTWQLAWPIIPLFLLVIFLGQRYFARMNERFYDLGIKFILLGSAISLLLKS